MREKIVNVDEAERTLRLVAGLEAPEGLAARLKERLAAVEAETAEDAQESTGRLLLWPARPHRADWLRGAAAALLLAAVAGGGWGVSRWIAPAAQVHTGPRLVARPVGQPGGFGGAGAMRTPKTLVGPEAPLDAVATPEKRSATRHGKNRKKLTPEQSTVRDPQ